MNVRKSLCYNWRSDGLMSVWAEEEEENAESVNIISNIKTTCKYIESIGKRGPWTKVQVIC